jgi:hypothetical protein
MKMYFFILSFFINLDVFPTKFLGSFLAADSPKNFIFLYKNFEINT